MVVSHMHLHMLPDLSNRASHCKKKKQKVDREEKVDIRSVSTERQRWQTKSTGTDRSLYPLAFKKAWATH
eukprot:5687722-Karenia_brevis.AAC.1